MSNLPLDPALFLTGEASDTGALAWLAANGFVDPEAALHRLQRLADAPGALAALCASLPHLLAALADTASPDHVLVSIERLAQGAGDRAELFAYLAQNPRLIEMLATLFAGSQFLTEILLQQPDYARRLRQRQDLNRRKTVDQYHIEGRAVMLAAADDDEMTAAAAIPALEALRRYQRWELLRLGACDFFGLMDLTAVTSQLSQLADGMVRACLDLAAAQTGMSPQGFVVLAMGKLGGGEVNYSSDIDLIFIARAGALDYVRLGQRLIEALSRMSAGGFLYRVDMRLRPWGRDGSLVSDIDGHLDYLRKHARLWEKQALLKARPIAGDLELGDAFVAQAQPILFDLEADTVRADVRAMKQRTEAYLRQHGREWGEVKLGEGSIRDVEFVVQYLQLGYGGRHPEVRSGRTLDALSRLFGAGLLSADAHRILGTGYVFFRTVEHHLQLMHYRQLSTLPADPAEKASLAKRLGFSGANAGEQFIARYQQHRDAVRRVYMQYLGSDPMESFASTPPPPSAGVQRHLERLDPVYATRFVEAEIRRHAALVENLSDQVPVQVDVVPLDEGYWRVTIVAYDYLGELSIICGLLFVYGLDIINGHIFTYEPLAEPASPSRPAARYRRPLALPRTDIRQKIVDVFTVRPVAGDFAPDVWTHYADELTALVSKLQARQRDEAQGALAKRVAAMLRQRGSLLPRLYPVDVGMDSESTERYTLLHISAPDTTGFLYELTNALALDGIYIARMEVSSVGNRVQDTLYVTDAQGHKIESPDRQRELRATIALVKHFTHLLPQAPNPELALLHFREFLAQLFKRTNWADELASVERPEVLDALAQLLGVSDFLWNDFLRMQYANLFPVVSNVDALMITKTKPELTTELQAELAAAHSGIESRRQALNAFKDREMFRIDMRHIMKYTSRFNQFSRELTELAEVVVDAAFRLCLSELRDVYGEPRDDNGDPSPIVVCALGKAGGHELGFASDIELMFVYGANGMTAGPDAITTAEFYEKLVAEFVRTIQARHEGIFEIDLQLRPYGKAGSMAVSLDAFRRYFAPGGPAWAYERQALVKLRPIAGDAELSQRLVAERDEFVYPGEVFDVAAMRAMRERQLRHLVTPGTINAKFSPGCLVDVEYLVQGLQITYGPQYPSVRQPNTREAMAALNFAGALEHADYQRLREAHTFLRRVINGLRMVRGHAKDLTVPNEGSEEFAFLARRMGYSDDPARLRDDLTHQTVTVQELSARLLDALAQLGQTDTQI